MNLRRALRNLLARLDRHLDVAIDARTNLLPGGDGGDLTFIAGKGGRGRGLAPDGRDGRIIFRFPDETEAMRIESNGAIKVRDEQVDDNKAIYEIFAKWLSYCDAEAHAGVLDGGDASFPEVTHD